ncbi:MAG: hypothetical protein ABS951_14935 [Solibacillus sp.]
MGLDDLLVDTEFQQVFRKIVKYELKGTPFLHEVPVATQRWDLNFLIIEEEINRLVFLILEDELARKDIVDFGQLLWANEILFEIPRLDYFAEPFKKVMQDGIVSEVEQMYIEEIRRVLQIQF